MYRYQHIGHFVRSVRPRALLPSPPAPRLNGFTLSPIQARIPIASIVGGAVALGGVTYFGSDLLQLDKPDLPPLPGTVPVLNLETATEKLRTEESTAYFDAGNGRQGQIFRLRVQSNGPTEDEYVQAEAKGQGGQALSFFGVLDGHAGWATSTLLRQALVPYVSSHLSTLSASASNNDLIATIKKSFLALDNKIMSDAATSLSSSTPSPAAISAIAPAISGSCALLSIYNASTSLLLTACVGDSRAVLGRSSPSPSAPGYSALPLSVDQTGKLPSERERILSAHPDEPDCVNPTTGRVLGLAVTRAFGDSRWKWDNATQTTAMEKFFAQAPRPGARPPPYLTAEPVVTETTVGKDDFLVLATDGLWDHMSSEDAVRCVELWKQGVQGGEVELARPGIKQVWKRRERVGKGSSDGYELAGGAYATWRAEEKDFVVEDGNAATHLVRNVLGGKRRGLFTGAMSTYAPISRNVRDDITVFVVFFGDVKGGNVQSKL